MRACKHTHKNCTFCCPFLQTFVEILTWRLNQIFYVKKFSMTSEGKDNCPEEDSIYFENKKVALSFSPLQFYCESRAICTPTSSQPFHLSEKPRLLVSLLYTIPGCGSAAEATARVNAPLERANNEEVAGSLRNLLQWPEITADAVTAEDPLLYGLDFWCCALFTLEMHVMSQNAV